MRMCGHNQTRRSGLDLRNLWKGLPFLVIVFGIPVKSVCAQATTQEKLSQQIQELTADMVRAQAQLEQTQHQLDEMRQQLSELQRQMAQNGANTATQSSSGSVPISSSSSSQDEPGATTAAIQDIRERQAMQESEITTLEQSKVESGSKYQIKVTGLLLLNGFVNTGAVDMAATPTVALPESGSTGATVRQTMLGVYARGPHLFGASSYADLWVDFDGSSASANTTATYSGYYNANATLLRLRTAHAGLQWDHTEAYFSLDRPIFSPDAPTSLTAVAVPALAWSGNLWTWNPQVGVNQDLGSSDARSIRLQAALVDVGDAPLTPPPPTTNTSPANLPSGAEESRWPGVEARIELRGPVVNSNGDRDHIGVGGYFAPHFSTLLGYGFDSWAGTLDAKLLLPAHLEFTGNFYRGLALGGLGGGAYKDFAYKPNSSGTGYYFRPLDDVGGWMQLKERISGRLEFNAAFGVDNAFAGELRPYTVAGDTMYQNLARSRTYTGNVIYSPSAYLKFSLEYRHLESSPVAGSPAGSNIIGLGAGYKF
jgi:uncharacterized membrane-anchored protein YhcB (DUF1043 family)